MNIHDDRQYLVGTKFAIGQPVPRTEDPMLVRGQGRYTDDVSLPGQAYAVMVRSRNAHGIIKAIDTEAARRCRACSRSIPVRTVPRLWHAQMRRAVQEPRRHRR